MTRPRRFDKILLKQPKMLPEVVQVDLTARGKQIRINIIRDARLKRGREVEGTIYPNRAGGWLSSQEFFCRFTALQKGPFADIRFQSANKNFSTENMRASRRVKQPATRERILESVADAFSVLIAILDTKVVRNKIPF